MPTWDEAQGYQRTKYRLIRDEPNWLGMEWQTASEISDGEPATHCLKIECISAFERPWLLLLATICAEDNIDVRSALRYNALLAIGSLAVDSGRCYLRAALPLGTITWAELDRAIEFIASEATKLRRPREDSGFVADVVRGFAE